MGPEGLPGFLGPEGPVGVQGIPGDRGEPGVQGEKGGRVSIAKLRVMCYCPLQNKNLNIVLICTLSAYPIGVFRG